MKPSSARLLAPVTFAAVLAAALAAFGNAAAFAQQQPPQARPARLVAPIDENVLTTLKGNVRADVAHAPDLGAVEDAKPLHLTLLLERTPAQKADLENLIARQQQPGAQEFHKWLTPAEFGARFGAAPEDIAKISVWLQSHGFEVRSVSNNASMINFAATAGQVRDAFHTQLHYVSLRGGKYPAMLEDPQIPAALAPVVAGIHGLNKIPPIPAHTPLRRASLDESTHRWHVTDLTGADATSPGFDVGNGYYNVTPQDLYTIYKIKPVFTGGNLAASATVAVIEESDMEYGTVDSTTGAATGGDVATFRSLFGVPGTLNMHVYHGYGSVTCNDPGIDPGEDDEDIEASIDAEWANATAPSANLIFMSCDQDVDGGIFSSMQALIDNNLSDVMSESYGASEIYYPTAADFEFLDDMYEQAATQGQSILISSGDAGSDINDQDEGGTAYSGINVSALSDSPLVTSAGGTDFQDYYDALKGGPAQSTYWSSTNSANYGDALSYVPEMAWNDSCASSILTNLESDTGAGFCATGRFASGYVVGGGHQHALCGAFLASRYLRVLQFHALAAGYSGIRLQRTRHFPASPDPLRFKTHLRWSICLYLFLQFRRSWRHIVCGPLHGGCIWFAGNGHWVTPGRAQSGALCLGQGTICGFGHKDRVLRQRAGLQHRRNHRLARGRLHLQRRHHRQQRRSLQNRIAGLLR
jgi:hypothetical protein